MLYYFSYSIFYLEEQILDRENVLVPEAELARQRDFEARIKAMFAGREAHPIACVDTFGCQQNVEIGRAHV